MEICLNIYNLNSIKNNLLLRIRLNLFLIGDDNVINIAILGEKDEKIFKFKLLSILTQLGFEHLNLNSKSKCDLWNYVILNSTTLEKSKEIKCYHYLVNMDKVVQNKNLVEGNLITYGYGSKNTITISSFEEEGSGFVYCVQRFININSIRVIEPQEIPVLIHIDSEEYLYIYMVAITIALIEGMNSEEVRRKLYNNNLIYSV